ncbi:MAG: contractile injection system protein, VgrG/Pvc8 family [Oxalobacter formigenes]|nr:contractile injection system protein, VgrG/Pvc8 family [Oxalobacter formigenes]
MNADNTVTLTVNGKSYGGWMSVEITAGIEQTARSFSLSVSHPWPGSGNDLPVKPGDACTVSLGSDKVITGWVDAVPVSFDTTSISRSVTGRSKTGDLVDCSAIWPGGQWKNQKIEKIAADLAGYYGVAVKTETDTGLAIAAHQIQQGESVFQSLDRLLRARQLYLTDDAEGNLVFIEVGKERAETALAVGENVLSGSLNRDHTGRFATYICKGQMTGDDDFYGALASQTQETGKDAGITRKRVLVIKQSGQGTAASCKNRALYERDSRAGKSLSGTYTVAGWRQGNGDLWEPNRMVKVVDPVSGFDDWLVIGSVTYRLDDGGMTTTLNVAPIQAFSRQVDGDKAQKAKSGKSGGANPWPELANGV